jgi:hypothetical protein
MHRLVSLLFAAAALSACASDPAPVCHKNDTRQCYCANGKTSAQTCDTDGQWQACVCGVDAGDSGNNSMPAADAPVVLGPPDAR